MTAARRSFATQDGETPCVQLDALWRKSMQFASSSIPVKILDEQTSDLHEVVVESKQWADRQHATIGIYPDGEVLKFLAKF